VILVPNITNGYRIKDDFNYSQFQIKINCPVCDSDNLNEGLENFLTCSSCNKRYKYGNGQIMYFLLFIIIMHDRLPINGQKDITDLNLNFQDLSNFSSFETIPEISQLVLSVAYETVPSEMKFAGNLDYYNIMHQMLLPFFQKRPRIVRENNFFTVGKVHFKVLSSDPSCGLVTKNTQIHCYR